MTDAHRERARRILTNPDFVTQALTDFRSDVDQTWYADRADTIAEVETHGSDVIGAASVDMIDLLAVCDSRGWTLTAEAGGVYSIHADAEGDR